MPKEMLPRYARAADAPLAEARARFEELVESLDAIVWEMDASTWQFTYVSRRAEDLLGYPVERWLEEAGFWSDVILTPRTGTGRSSSAPAPPESPGTTPSSTAPAPPTAESSGCTTWSGSSGTRTDACSSAA